MKNRVPFVILLLLLLACKTKDNTKIGNNELISTKTESNSCKYAFGLIDAMNCAAVAADISAYNEDWPENSNSKIFFTSIENNLNLRSLSFCFVYVDSLPSSIGQVKNLETLQLTEGNITSIPKEIGQLKN